MTKKAPIAVLDTDTEQHPASLAWRQVDDGKHIPQVIEVLQHRRKTSIYRLRGFVSDKWTIIAKRCLSETGRLERVIYEEILPYLPVSALQYYGSVTETGSHVWLFLQDAGTRRFSIVDESHRVLAAHWLGTLHSSAEKTPAVQILPGRGPAYYLELMRRGREYIVHGLANSVMSPTDLDLLQRILRQFDVLESNWQDLLEICKDIPLTLIHGDFQSKNIYVKETSAEVLYVVDWEMAGWGIPLIDIAPSSGSSKDAQVHLPVYLSILRGFWPNLDMPTLQYYVHVGVIFRRLAAIYWSSLELSYPWIEDPIQSMIIYHKELAHAMVSVFGKELTNGGRT